MKKLMTMIAAVGMAFGLFAESEKYTAGTSFEATQPTTLTKAWENGAFVSGFWKGTEANTAKVVDVTHNMGTQRPDIFNDGLQTDLKGLEIASTLGNPVEMNVQASGNPWTNDGEFYFDGLVNMTVFDKGDVPDMMSAKFAACLELANADNDSKTNFVVFANGQKYECASDTDVSEGWHRLTIRAIANINESGTAQAGFVLYIDGTAVECTAAKITDATSVAKLSTVAYTLNNAAQLFISGAPADATITSIGFDGKGKVDELVFTETRPEFIGADPATFKVVLDTDRATQVSIDGEHYVDAPAFFNVADATAGKIWWKGAANYCDGSKVITPESGKVIEIEDSDVAEASFKIGDNSYATLSNAFEAATAAGAKIEVVENYPLAVGEVAVLNNTAGSTILDLAGKVITGSFSALTDLVITNSDATFMGQIAGDPAIEQNAGTLMIFGGYINGSLSINDRAGATCSTYGGQFSFNPKESGFVPAGFYAKEITENALWEVLAKTAIPIPTAVTGLEYTGESLTGVEAGTGYTLTGNTATDAGEHTATATLADTVATMWVGGSTDAQSIKWEIAAKAVTPDVSVEPMTADFSDTLEYPTVSVKDYTDADYNYEWDKDLPKENPESAVVLTVTVTMKGNYKGSNTATFTVTPKKSDGPVTPDDGGGEVEPVPGEDGVYVVTPDSETKNVTIVEGSLKNTDIIRVTTTEDITITGVPAEQIQVKIGDKVIPNGAFMGGTPFSTALDPNGEVTISDEVIKVQPTIADVAGDDTFDITGGKVATKAIPGLTYTLNRSTVLGGDETQADQVTATTTTVDLTDKIKGEKPAAAFYQIKVSK